ncbi:MAG TPA: polyprenyl synthetase family protein, partial [Actinomycetales bacterium]|nr:polyprenyl synthetase family protein [Actinomycetales bacterium]
IIAALGTEDLPGDEVDRVRGILTGCGAVAAHEEMIAARRRAALGAVDDLGADAAVADRLRETIERLTTRDS